MIISIKSLYSIVILVCMCACTRVYVCMSAYIVIMCLYMCVYMYVCVAHMVQYICGCQRQPQPSVFQDCCLWIFPAPCKSAGITDAQECVWLSTESEDPNSGPHACTESSLSTEPSPQAHSHWKTNQNQNYNNINNKSPRLQYIILRNTCVGSSAKIL